MLPDVKSKQIVRPMILWFLRLLLCTMAQSVKVMKDRQGTNRRQTIEILHTRKNAIVLPDMSRPLESAHSIPLMNGFEESDACKARSMMAVYGTCCCFVRLRLVLQRGLTWREENFVLTFACYEGYIIRQGSTPQQHILTKWRNAVCWLQSIAIDRATSIISRWYPIRSSPAQSNKNSPVKLTEMRAPRATNTENSSQEYLTLTWPSRIEVVFTRYLGRIVQPSWLCSIQADPNCISTCWIHFFFLEGTLDRYRLQENDLQVGACCHGGICCSGTW